MNKNYFSLLNEGSVQMHGFEHLSDTFYVKPLVTKNSLTIFLKLYIFIIIPSTNLNMYFFIVYSYLTYYK